MRSIALLLLAGSVTINAVLFFRWHSSAAVPISPPALQERRDVDSSAAASVPPNPQTWEKLRPENLPAFVAQLRARGFPSVAIRALVRERVREGFADRYQAIADSIDALPYWNSGGLTFVDAKTQLAQHALERDVAEAMRDLLGPEAVDLDRLRRSYGDHAPEQLHALDWIVADYRNLAAGVGAQSRGVMLAEDRAQLALLEREKRRDIERLLGAEKLELFELHSSSTANALRQQLSAFGPTEAEFRALFTIKRDFTAAFGSPEHMTPEERRQLTESEKGLAPQIEAALGPERFAEYRQKTDPGWMFAHRFVIQQGLPAGTTAQLFALQREVEQRAMGIRNDSSLPPERRDAQLSALGQEATGRLLPTLGAKGLGTYRQQGAGNWLNRLAPPPRQGPKL